MPKLDKLKFEEFDTQLQNELKRANCMVPNQFDPSGAQLLKLMELAEGFSHTGFINLLFMPHFSHSLQVNTYVKQLLVLFHRGCMWLDKQHSVVAELILAIIGLPNQGDDLAPYLAQKDTTQIKRKFNLKRAKKGYLIQQI